MADAIGDSWRPLPPEGTPPSVSPFRDLQIKAAGEHPLEWIHHILSNEMDQAKILGELGKQLSPSDGIHFGFSCWFNFDIIATTRPQLAIISDIDSNMIALLDLMRNVIKESDSRDDFINTFWNELETQFGPDQEGPFSLVGANPQTGENEVYARGDFHDVVSHGLGWLSDDDKFLFVKEMYAQEKIRHVEINATDPTSMAQLRTWAGGKGYHFDTVYTSNVGEVTKIIGKHKYDPFKEAMSSVVTDQTRYVHAHKDSAMKGSPRLRLAPGKIPEIKYSHAPRTAPRKRKLR